MSGRLPAEEKRAIGRRLVERKAGVQKQRELAELLGVRPRTLRNWMRASRSPPKRVGRPPLYTREMRRQTLRVVIREMRRQGRRVGWPAIVESVGKGVVRTRLLQATLKRVKARMRKRMRRRIRNRRVSVTVNAVDAVWTQDGTHLGRVGGRAVKAQVVMDRASTKKISSAVLHKPKARDVLELFELTKRTTGRLPLVWQVDNDKIYHDGKVAAYLEKEKIVALFSRPYTPTDNGAAEVGMRDLKAISGLGKGVKLRSLTDAAALHGDSMAKLNENRLRASRGHRSANTLYETQPPWYNFIDRDRFYQEACEDQELAVQGKVGAEAQEAKRQAVHMVMARHGVVTIFRGGKPCTLENVERIL